MGYESQLPVKILGSLANGCVGPSGTQMQLVWVGLWRFMQVFYTSILEVQVSVRTRAASRRPSTFRNWCCVFASLTSGLYGYHVFTVWAAE